jgi:hypothetical protein
LATQVTADFFSTLQVKKKEEDSSSAPTSEKSSLGKAIPENLEDRCQKEFVSVGR